MLRAGGCKSIRTCSIPSAFRTKIPSEKVTKIKIIAKTQ